MIPPGYKQTEVGVIPEEWEVKSLGAVLSKGRLGGNYANQDAECELPLMKMGNLARGCFDLSKVQFISSGVRPELFHRLVYGDVLFNTRNTLDLVGKVAIWRNELPVAYYNSNLMRLEFDPQQVCSNEYANYALNTEGAVSRLRALATGTTSVAAIYTRDLMKLQVVVPPLPEQRAIAEALSDVDGLLGGLDRLIAKKRDLKQAAMQQLLTGQTRLPGFKGEWVVKRLDEVASLNRQNVIPASLPSQMFVHFSLPAFDDGKLPVVELGSAIGSNKFRVTQGAVLVSKLNPRIPRVWAPKEIPEHSVASTEFLVLTPKEGTSRNFLFVVCASPWFCEQMELAATGTTGSHQRISPSGALDLKVSIPVDAAEQTAIASVLSEMDAELAALEQRREKTRALKQGMMQELLTGRTRLIG